MRTLVGSRASAILYDLLLARRDSRPFLLPANICPIVPLTFFKAGVAFEFVDISPRTLAFDFDQAYDRLSRPAASCGGLLYVHTYGDPMLPDDAFRQIKHRFPDLLLVDDRCLCIPDLEPAPGNPADVILYSTGYAKMVDIGLGGYAFLRDDLVPLHCRLPYDLFALEIVERAYKEALAAGRPFQYADGDWLQTDADLPPWPRYAQRLSESVQASLDQRRRLNAVYDALLPERIRLPADYQHWRYNIRVKDNRELLAAIFAGGLFASRHYASLAGIFGPGEGSHAAELAGQVVNLFNDHHYSPEMAERTAQIVLGSL